MHALERYFATRRFDNNTGAESPLPTVYGIEETTNGTKNQIVSSECRCMPTPPTYAHQTCIPDALDNQCLMFWCLITFVTVSLLTM